MIKNDTTAIGQLASSTATFYLTGSRFFETHRDYSDYDFFVQGDAGLAFELEQMGFKREPGGCYADPLTLSVWVKENVHVQVVSNAKLKITIQDFLRESGLLNTRLSKVEQRLIWKVAILSYQRWV
jgi:hypothetical protein